MAIVAAKTWRVASLLSFPKLYKKAARLLAGMLTQKTGEEPE